MIERYSLAEMADLFAEEAKMARWAEVELVALEAMAAEGLVPAEAAAACRAAAPRIDSHFVARVEERERTTDHDLAAFVDVMQDSLGMPHGTWLHYGLTSTDVVDTAQCWVLRDAADTIISALDDLVAALVGIAREHRDTPMIGRTHGIHAEPTTFGAKVALWALQVDRDRTRMRTAREAIAVCKLSGAVGTYSHLSPAVEARVGAALGLAPVPATQVVARDRHAEYLWACAAVGATMEAIAVELRHLQRTEVAEVAEGFTSGQKGSSAMPHKRNPISAETISGLSRVLKSNVQVGLGNVALWHERDISHSSAERIVLADSSILAHYVTRRMLRLVSSLEVDAQRMRRNLDMLHGVVFSQSVLLALVESGMSRDEAYRIVQGDARSALDDGRPFEDVLRDDARVGLADEAITEIFNLSRVLRHAGHAVDAASRLA